MRTLLPKQKILHVKERARKSNIPLWLLNPPKRTRCQHFHALKSFRKTIGKLGRDLMSNTLVDQEPADLSNLGPIKIPTDSR
jgi:hypothetical protein